MRAITVNWLRERGACPEAIKIFQGRFGEKAFVKDIIKALHEIKRDNWEAWLLAQELKLTVLMLRWGANLHAHGDAALCWATENGCLRMVQFFLENGADVHAHKDAALCWAAEDGYLKIVELLIENGADIHAKNDTALRLAARDGHAKVVTLLTKQAQKV